MALVTTWEIAPPSDVETIRTLLAKARRAGVVIPPMPTTLDERDWSRLTKRDAGKAISLLREAMNDRTR